MKCTVNLTMVLWYLYHVKKARMQLNLFPVGKQIIVSQRYTVSDMHRKCYTMERNYIASSGLYPWLKFNLPNNLTTCASSFTQYKLTNHVQHAEHLHLRACRP